MQQIIRGASMRGMVVGVGRRVKEWGGWGGVVCVGLALSYPTFFLFMKALEFFAGDV